MAKTKETKCKVQIHWSRGFSDFLKRKETYPILLPVSCSFPLVRVFHFSLPIFLMSWSRFLKLRIKVPDIWNTLQEGIPIQFINVFSCIKLHQRLAFFFIFVLFCSVHSLNVRFLLMPFNPQFHRSGRKYGFIMITDRHFSRMFAEEKKRWLQRKEG